MTIIILIIAHHFIVSKLIEKRRLKGIKWFMVGGFMVSIYHRIFKLISFIVNSLINGIIKLKRKIA